MSRKHPPKPVIAIVVLTVLGLLGWWIWRTVAASNVDAATLTGAVESTDYQVASLAAATVTAVEVKLGDEVTKGQVLVRLDAQGAQAQVAQAKAGVNAARATLASEIDTGSSADQAVARARVTQAKAALRLAKVQLGYLVVRAPHDGVVSSVIANAGQVASPGRTLITLSDSGDQYVRVFVPESELASIKVGQSASIKADGSDATYSGTVSSIATTAEFTPNNIDTKDQRTKLVYAVRVAIDDTSGALKAGQPVDVTWK